MTSDPCTTRLFAYIPAPQEAHGEILLGRVAPLFDELRTDPGLVSLSFTRSSTPEWLLRLLVHGSDAFIATTARPLVGERLASLPGVAIRDSSELPGYRSEIDRWGGELGILLAERTFHHDSAACLDWMRADARGAVERTRREHCLLMTDRLLDLFGCGREARLAVYRRGFAWAVEDGTWSAQEVEAIERNYRQLRPGLEDLLGAETRSDAEACWGGAEPARIAETCLDALRPVAAAWIEARDAGRLAADWTHLVWSLAHVHAIRLGIASESEAVLRYFMFRLLEDAAAAAQ